MLNRNKIIGLPLCISIAMLFSACGGAPTQTSTPVTTNNPPTVNQVTPNPVVSVTPITCTNSAGVTGTCVSSTITGSFTLGGDRGGTATTPSKFLAQGLYTATVLKIKLTGQAAGGVTGTGSSINSGCLSFDVQVVDDTTKQNVGGYKTFYVDTAGTGTCKTSYSSSSARNSVTSTGQVDFSYLLASGQSHPLDFQISNPHSDACPPGTDPSGAGAYYTLAGNWPYQYYQLTSCWNQLYYNYNVSGGYEITVNNVSGG